MYTKTVGPEILKIFKNIQPQLKRSTFLRNKQEKITHSRHRMSELGSFHLCLLIGLGDYSNDGFQFSNWRPYLLMFRSRKLSSLKKMSYHKRQKMLQDLESSFSKVGW